MNETMEQIQSLSNERQQLYRLAGKQHLTDRQRQRIDELTGRLATLWDTHRRELAAERRFRREGEGKVKELYAA